LEVDAKSTLLFKFTLPSKGGGDTNIQLEIPKESFGILIAEMFDVDRDKAVTAILLEMARQHSSEEDRIHAFGREGEWRVLNAARKKYRVDRAARDDPKNEVAWRAINEIVDDIRKTDF